jgi:hypothetical protein
MKILIRLGKQEREMSTDNGIPRVGDLIEFAHEQFATVTVVRWNLCGPPPYYESGYVSHQAVITLAPA